MSNFLKMRTLLLLSIFVLPFLGLAQNDSIRGGIYHWKQPLKQKKHSISTTPLCSGMTNDLQNLIVNCNVLISSKKHTSMVVPSNEEQMLMIKSGSCIIHLKDSTYSITAGSVAIIMPGDTYTLDNTNKTVCEYYQFKYQSKQTVDLERGSKSGGSFVKDISKIEFKPTTKGGGRKYFEKATAMTKRAEMHMTTLNVGLKSHEPHQHKAAEIVLLTQGDTEMQIGEIFYKAVEGDLIYLPSNNVHALTNKGNNTCTYLAFQFE